MTKFTVNLARRKFMLAAGSAGVVGAAAVMLGRPPAVKDIAPPEDQSGSRGYHETAHIRKYYRTARLI